MTATDHEQSEPIQKYTLHYLAGGHNSLNISQLRRIEWEHIKFFIAVLDGVSCGIGLQQGGYFMITWYSFRI